MGRSWALRDLQTAKRYMQSCGKEAESTTSMTLLHPGLALNYTKHIRLMTQESSRVTNCLRGAVMCMPAVTPICYFPAMRKMGAGAKGVASWRVACGSSAVDIRHDVERLMPIAQPSGVARSRTSSRRSAQDAGNHGTNLKEKSV